MGDQGPPTSKAKIWQRLLTATGLGEGRLDQSALRRQAVDGILGRARLDRRGGVILPPAVEIRIAVGPAASLGAVRRLVDDPAFDAEIGADLCNRLRELPAAGLPARLYTVDTAQRSKVEVHDAVDAILLELVVLGGDRHGTRFPIRASRNRWNLGRGRWHDAGGRVENQLVISHRDRFVSRRAAVLRRSGTAWLLEPMDHADRLGIARPNGRWLRPGRLCRRAVPIAAGDVVVLGGASQVGRHAAIELRFVRPGAPFPIPKTPRSRRGIQTSPSSSAFVITSKDPSRYEIN